MITEICKAGRCHLEEIKKIEDRAFSRPWSKASILAEIENPDTVFAVALEQERVVGFCILHIFSDEAEIFNIAVEEACRGKKIGEKLMRFVFEGIEKTDVKTVFLEVRCSNLPAIGLYKKCGFFPVGRRRNYYDEPTEDAVIMRCNFER